MFIHLPSKVRDISNHIGASVIFTLLMLGGFPVDASEDLQGNNLQESSFQGVDSIEAEFIMPAVLITQCEKGSQGSCSGTSEPQVPAGAGGNPRPTGRTALA